MFSVLRVSNNWWLRVSLLLLPLEIHAVLNFNNFLFCLYISDNFISSEKKSHPLIKALFLTLHKKYRTRIDHPSPQSKCSAYTTIHTYWHQQKNASQSIRSPQSYLQITKHLQQPIVSSRICHNYDVWYLNRKFKILSFLCINART